MLKQQDQLNGSAAAFIRAFSDLIKDSTSHLATKDDINQLSDRIDWVKTDLNNKIETTNKNMQAQFAEQEKKFAHLGREISAMGKKISDIERKL